MKNFLIELFRPLDTLIFNHLVRIGGINSFVQFLPAILGGIGSAVAYGGAQRAGKKLERGVQGAIDAQRDPSEIIQDFYGPEGLLGQETQGLIQEREKALLPGYLDLQKQQAQSQILGQGGLFDIGEEARLRELGFMGQFGQQARDTFEDPRLAQIAEADLAEATRLTQEAQGPLGFEAAREADQAAARFGLATGRSLDASQLARAALGRQDAVQARQDQAAAARRNALISAGQASVDPFGFLGGQAQGASALSAAFLGQAPGPLVTDPGQAINLGMGQDINLANLLMGKAQAGAQTSAATSSILGSGLTSLGTNLGSAFGGGTGGTQGNFNFASAAQSVKPRNYGFQADPNSLTGGGFNYLQD